MTAIRQDALSGFRRITIENGIVRARFLPELGGKMTSLVRIASGHEFLLQPQRPLRRQKYGAAFADFDTSGFDECIPTISACPHPESARQSLPDHGELWSVPWQTEIVGEGLQLAAEGTALPYCLTKIVRLQSSEVVIDYVMMNKGNSDVKFLWSAHPLLSVEPGNRITLPPEVTNLLVNYSYQERLGTFGNQCGWPVAQTAYGEERLDTLKPPSVGFADKLFTSRLSEGYCALYKPVPNESISFRFDAAKVPYVGLWICQGGWPNRAHGHYTVALEPCTGRTDSLLEAIARGEHDVLPAQTTKGWNLRLKLQPGPPDHCRAL